MREGKTKAAAEKEEKGAPEAHAEFLDNSDTSINPDSIPHTDSPLEAELTDALEDDDDAKNKKASEARDYLQEFKIRQLEAKVKDYEKRTADIRDYVKRMEGEIVEIRDRSQREIERS